MIKVAIIDDGIPAFITKKYRNISMHYMHVIANRVIYQKWTQYKFRMTHAGLCFQIYAQNIDSKIKLQLFSIDVIGKKNKIGSIQQLLIALEWCVENSIQIINLSVGSLEYWDYFLLQPILAKAKERNIMIVTAHSNCFKFSFPAISRYTMSARFDSNNHEKHEEKYKVINNKIPNFEYVFPKSRINNISQYVNLDNECNSFAAPLLSAEVTNKLYYVNNNDLENYMFKNCKVKLEGRQLWDYRKKYIFKQEITIPVIWVFGNKESYWEITKQLTTLFMKKKYAVVTMSSFIEQSEMPYFHLNTVLMNCDNRIKESVIFMQNYSNVDLLIIQIETEMMKKIFDMKLVEIAIYKKYILDVENQRKRTFEYSSDLFEKLLFILEK